MDLKLNEVSRFFGSALAVNGVSFEIDTPSVVGFLGPNGAGKTTTMRIITGFLAASKGSVTIDGEAVSPENVELRSRIGYLPESNPLYTELEVHEYLKFAAELSGLNPSKAEERLEYVADRCGIKEVLYEPIYQLSRGYKQRVGLAQAIIHDPEILILDEPTSGLDPNQVVGIRGLIFELAMEKFVVLSTHILSEVQALCGRVLIINRGKLVLDATKEELQNASAGNISLVIRSGSSVEVVKNVLENTLHITGISSSGELESWSGERTDVIALRLAMPDSSKTREQIFDACVSNGYKILELNRSGSDLEKLFRELTTANDETGQQ